MNDSEREQIKLTATYLNGIAISIVAVYGIAFGLYIPRELPALMPGGPFAFWLWFFFGALGVSFQLHRFARGWLERLDRE